MTLKSIRRAFGDNKVQARPITFPELLRIHEVLDMTKSEGLAL